MRDDQTWAILIGLMTATATMFGFLWRLVTQSLDVRFNLFEERISKGSSESNARWDKQRLEDNARWDKQRLEDNARWDKRFNANDLRFEQINSRLDKIDFRFDTLDQKIDEVGRRASVLEDDVRAMTRHLFNGPEAA